MLYLLVTCLQPGVDLHPQMLERFMASLTAGSCVSTSQNLWPRAHCAHLPTWFSTCATLCCKTSYLQLDTRAGATPRSKHPKPAIYWIFLLLALLLFIGFFCFQPWCFDEKGEAVFPNSLAAVQTTSPHHPHTTLTYLLSFLILHSSKLHSLPNLE